MKPSLQEKLRQLADRLKTLDQRLSEPGVHDDLDEFRRISKERAEIEPVVALYASYCRGDALRPGHEGFCPGRNRRR